MVHVMQNSPEACSWCKTTVLNSKEDVATLLEVYEKCLQSFNPEDISGVAERDGFYVCIVNPGVVGDFDLFALLNTGYVGDGRTEISCANARFLFPADISRGEYMKRQAEVGVSDTNDFEDKSDETDTGFWDEDEINGTRYVKHIALGESIPIEDEDGVIFGRSTTRSGYSVNNDLMSRLHARVYLEDGKYMVEDLGSKNGTFINNVRVFPGKDREIKLGNTLRMADEEFKFV